MSDPRQVLLYALAHFDRSPKRPALSKEDLCLAEYIIDVSESAAKGDYQIISDQYVTHFDDDDQDLDWTPEDEEFHKINVYPDVVHLPGAPNLVQFGRGEFVELSEVKKAVEYYGSKDGFHNNGNRVRPSLASINRKFRFVKDANHVQKLREYEANGTVKANRKNNLEFLSVELEKDVRKNVEAGKVLHDHVLRFLIRDIIRKNDLDLSNFVASHSWLAGWKKRYGVSSRKITKFVSQVNHKSREQIEKDAKEFVMATNQVLPSYFLDTVYNADQSGFQIEMNTARTLTFKGMKHVHCTVQSASSTTHSYTVMPLISASGKLHNKLFVTLKEKNGKFPKRKKVFNAPNLVLTCHTSHIMTKTLMKEFFEKIVFHPSMPKNALLIVDSWSSWKDQKAIDEVTPPSNKLKVLMIPAGCTGRVQPCDVGIFGGFKKIMKHITAHAQLAAEEYKINTRDNLLALLSLVWWQLCAPELEPWAQYAWHASGYDVPRPVSFLTPSQAIFPSDVAGNCDGNRCSRTSFLFCLYCKKRFCFHCFVIQYHMRVCKKK